MKKLPSEILLGILLTVPVGDATAQISRVTRSPQPEAPQAQAPQAQAPQVQAPQVQAPQDPIYRATLEDIRREFGFVPTFMARIPEGALPGAWQEFKVLALSDTGPIPRQYRDMIAIGVSIVSYPLWGYYHQLMMGDWSRSRTDAVLESNEAIHQAGIVRHWASVLGSIRQSEKEFRKEVDSIFSHRMAQSPGAPGGEQAGMAARENYTKNPTYSEIESVWGKVPSFMKEFPSAALDGAWRELRDFSSKDTRLPRKYKDLISLAVAAQLQCENCVYFYRKSALQSGATEEEMQQALAMSGLVGRWGGMLLSSRTLRVEFLREVRRMRANRVAAPRLQLGGQAAPGALGEPPAGPRAGLGFAPGGGVGTGPGFVPGLPRRRPPLAGQVPWGQQPFGPQPSQPGAQPPPQGAQQGQGG